MGLPLDFPSSPAVNQKWPQPPVSGQPVYTWDGEKWLIADLSGKTPIYTDGSTGMTAQLTLVNPPVNPTDAAAKAYVDSKTPIASAAEYLSGTSTKLLTPKAVWDAIGTGITAVTTPIFTPDFNTQFDFVWSLTSPNCQLNNPANYKIGQRGIITLVQDATGGRLITTWGSAYKFTMGVKPSLSTSPNTVDMLSYFAAGSVASPVLYCFFTPAFG